MFSKQRLSSAWQQVRFELQARSACMHARHRACGLQQILYLSAALSPALHAAPSAPARKAA